MRPRSEECRADAVLCGDKPDRLKRDAASGNAQTRHLPDPRTAVMTSGDSACDRMMARCCDGRKRCADGRELRIRRSERAYRRVYQRPEYIPSLFCEGRRR